MRFTFVILLFLSLGADAQMIIKAHANYRPYAVAAPGANLLLDDYPNAAAAYSLRKLDKDYTGSAIRVRRSNDNAEQDIGFTSSGDLDTGALKTFVGAGNNGFVTVWYDQSGNARNATQTTAARQPRIVNGGNLEKYDKLTTLNLGNQNNHWFLSLPTGILNNATNVSYFHVASLNDSAVGNSAIFGPRDNGSVGLEILQGTSYTNTSTIRINNSIRNNNANEIYRIWHANENTILSIFGNTSKVEVFKNTNKVTLTDSSSLPTLNYNGVYSIGTYATNLSTTNNANGTISELILYESNQISNRNGIESNINNFYNTKYIDDYAKTNPFTILSLRKLIPNYTGACIRLRRSNDNTESDFNFVNNYVDTASIKTWVSNNSAFVVRWYDQLSLNNFEQTTAANQPRFVNSGSFQFVNNKPIVNFGANTDNWFLESPSGYLNGVRRLTFNAVWNVIDFATSNAGVFAPSTTNSTGLEILQHSVISRPSYLRINALARTVNQTPGIWDNNTQSLTSIFGTEGERLRAYKNNSSITMTNTGMSQLTFNGKYSLGRYSSGNYMNGSMQEIIIYNKIYDRNSVANEINTYYSIY